MNYLIVCKSNEQHYLLMTKNDDETYSIKGYESKEKIMDTFSGYNKGWTEGVERSASCIIGMMQMQPVAIEAPENPETLKEFIIEMKISQVSGGAIGRGYTGLPVKEGILKFKQFEIWKESMIVGGIM